MIKKVYILFVFFLTIFILFNFNKADVKPIDIDLNQIDNSKMLEKPVKNEIIEKINAKNRLINSISYNKIEIKADLIKLTAILSYEKKLNFRMITNSFLGKESDLGSNDSNFWFWSRQMNPPYLFYSNHENLHKTRLRTPFNPKWMIKILGINEIDEYDACFLYKENLFAIVKYDKNNYNKKITLIDLIDIEKNAFYGHYIFNSYNEMMVAAEVKDYYYIDGSAVPKTIYINWIEENLNVIWNLSKPSLNQNLSKENWLMPNNYKKVDLIDYKD